MQAVAMQVVHFVDVDGAGEYRLNQLLPRCVHDSCQQVEDFTRLGFDVSVTGVLDEPATRANIMASWCADG